MSTEKMKLFQTVAEIFNRGDISLTSSDRNIIEEQTQDLIRNTMFHRSASPMSEDLKELLPKLKSAKSADEAYALVVSALKNENALQDEEEAMKIAREEVIRMSKEVSAQSDNKPPFIPKDDKDDKDKDDKDKDDKDDKDKPPSVPKKDDDKDDKGKGKEKKMDKIRDDEKKPIPTPDEIGIDQNRISRSKKAKIIVTADGNITAHHSELGPMFIAIPDDNIKKDRKALARLANRVKGIILYEGWKRAAEVCGTKLIQSGVDDDVETETDVDIQPATEPVDAGGDTDAREDADNPESTTTTGGDTDAEEKPKGVTGLKDKMKQRARAKRKTRGKGVQDGAMVPTVEKPKDPGDDSTAGGDDDHDVDPPAPAKSTMDDVEVDFKTAELEENFKKLYKARAQTELQKHVEAFARKFTRCVKIASMRMRLNHDAHEFKEAIAGILMCDDIEFSNGDVFRSMDQKTAVELTELITHEGHEKFVDSLLSKAADLLEKGDEFLEEVETDLYTLDPAAVEVDDQDEIITAPMSDVASNVREKMSRGNPHIETMGLPTEKVPTQSKSAGISDAIGGSTRLGRRISNITR